MNSSKERARRRLLALRQGLAPSEVKALSEAVQAAFIETDCYGEAASVALYSSIRGEVETEVVFARALGDGKEVFFPRLVVTGKARGEARIEFCRVGGPEDLVPGPYGIDEPGERSEAAGNFKIDVIVTPGVAFDRFGGRLGYGAGHYDRALAPLSSVRVGFAYDLQLTDGKLPTGAHDQKMDMVVTEKEVIEF